MCLVNWESIRQISRRESPAGAARRGARNVRDNPKEEVKSSLRSGLPLSLKVFPHTLFPHSSPPLMRAAYLCLYGGVQYCESYSCCAVDDGISRKRTHKLPVLIWGTLALGAVASQKALRAVYLIKWESFANRPRRDMPAGAARRSGLPLSLKVFPHTLFPHPSPALLRAAYLCLNGVVHSCKSFRCCAVNGGISRKKHRYH